MSIGVNQRTRMEDFL